MAKTVITEEQGEAILRQREEHALEELREIGFRISLYEPRVYVEPDPLLGEAGGWKIGTCYVTAYSAAGKQKTISAMSAVDALRQAKAWLHYQESRLSPELRFVIEKGDGPTAVPVQQRIAGDTAETAARHTKRKVLAFDSGVAEVVDAHGTPLPEATHASQFATSNMKGDTPDEQL
jgi:hypothetical protein